MEFPDATDNGLKSRNYQIDPDEDKDLVQEIMRAKSLVTTFVGTFGSTDKATGTSFIAIKEKILEMEEDDSKIERLLSEVSENSIELMNQWVAKLVSEVDTIDSFFVEKLKEYVKNFVDIQSQYLSIRVDKKKTNLINPLSGSHIGARENTVTNNQWKKL
jgi:hypothetical protein